MISKDDNLQSTGFKNISTSIQSNKQPSSHTEFFQRLYGNLERSSISLDERKNKLHKIDALKGTNVNVYSDRSSPPFIDHIWSIQHNSNTNKNELPDVKSFLLPCYNIHIHSRNFEFSMKPLCTPAHVMPVALGLSAFLPRKKRKEGKVRRRRTTFTNQQTTYLENEFRINEYIPRYRRYELAKCLRLTETQIKIWFQNRRAKDKRIEKAHLDQQYRYSFMSHTWTTPHPYPNDKIQRWEYEN